MPDEPSMRSAPSHLSLMRRLPLFALACRPQGAVAGMFFAYGIGGGSWSGASAAILSRVGVGASLYGVALTVYTGAYLVAMSSASALTSRLGVKRVLLGAALAMATSVSFLLLARDAVAFFAALIVSGFFSGLVDLTMNATGARIERGLGRPILARLHGSASAGYAAGAASGGLIAASAAPWASCLLVVAALASATALVAAIIPRDPVAAAGATAIGRAKLVSRTLVVLGLVIGVSIACESAALQWSALILRREAPQWAALAGFGAAFFAGSQASLRFNADRVRARVADGTLIMVSLGVAAIGFVVVAADAGFAASVIGFAIIGVGTGSVVPCGFAIAASRPGVSAAAGLSTAAFFGSIVRLPAPLITGAVASAVSLSTAFALFAGLLIAALGATALFIARPARAPSL
jgi:hypothetical protein